MLMRGFEKDGLTNFPNRRRLSERTKRTRQAPSILLRAISIDMQERHDEGGSNIGNFRFWPKLTAREADFLNLKKSNALLRAQ